MASQKAVWGIDVGKCALKALKLHEVNGDLRVDGFDVIEHAKILTQPDAKPEQLIRAALEQFLARNNVHGAALVVSAPGQSGFTRFVKLPPVESKQVPELVQFEAVQQIPFNIEEVIWRWQAFEDPDSPDIEVGIFAMKRSDVAEVLDRFTEVGLGVDTVQMAPLALYNFMDFDEQSVSDGATLLVDIGADKTDLVVSDGPRIWTRTLQLGGNNFTEALVKAFKLSFTKAEKLKRTAATSKYARQIFQAMRPVFAELVQEIQRSIGYYTSQHRESRFKRVVGLGNGFRLPGLQKFLEQNLNLPVARVDSYNKLSPSAAVNAPAFAENAPSFAVAYGLALQGLGLTRILTNLLPGEITRRRRWARKRLWFAPAAAMVLLVFAAPAWRSHVDMSDLDPSGNSDLQAVEKVVGDSEQLRGEFNQVQGQDKGEEGEIRKYFEMEIYRDFWPMLHHVVSKSVARVATDQGLLDLSRLDRLMEKPRPQRRVVYVDSLRGVYQPACPDLKSCETVLTACWGGGAVRASGTPTFAPDPVAAFTPPPPAPPGPGGIPSPLVPGAPASPAQPATPGRGFLLYLAGSTPQRGPDAVRFVADIKNMLVETAREFPAIEVTGSQVVDLISGKPVAPGTGEVPTMVDAFGRLPRTGLSVGADRANLDPLTGEATNEDTRFVLGWVVVIKIKGDGSPGSPGAGGGAP